MSIEHQANNMPNTSFAFVQSVLTTPPCTLGTLLTYSRMLFNLKINKTLSKREQRLHSEAEVLLCSWVQLNPQKDYSHPLTGPSCNPATRYAYAQNGPFVKQEGLKRGTVCPVMWQPRGKKFTFGPSLGMLVPILYSCESHSK